jgi:hypothetical protein
VWTSHLLIAVHICLVHPPACFILGKESSPFRVGLLDYILHLWVSQSRLFRDYKDYTLSVMGFLVIDHPVSVSSPGLVTINANLRLVVVLHSPAPPGTNFAARLPVALRPTLSFYLHWPLHQVTTCVSTTEIFY